MRLFPLESRRSGSLAIATRPRGDDWLDDDLAALKDAGIDVLVSMLDPQEQVDLGLSDEAPAAARAGLTYVSVPTIDRGVPTDLDSFSAALVQVRQALTEGQSVAIHCR